MIDSDSSNRDESIGIKIIDFAELGEYYTCLLV